jgi:hypothetical protein
MRTGAIIVGVMSLLGVSLLGVSAYAFWQKRAETKATIASSGAAGVAAQAQIDADFKKLAAETKGDVLNPEIFERGDVSDQQMINFYVVTHNPNLPDTADGGFGWTKKHLRSDAAVVDAEIARRNLNQAAVAALLFAETGQ